MTHTAAQPVPSATLILARDGADGLEVLLLQRHAASRGMGGMFVFPGGVLEPADGGSAITKFCSGPDDQACSTPFGQTSGGLAYRVAALRECFEEAGVLLSRVRSGELNLLDAASAARIAGYRDDLNAGSLQFAEFCRKERLVLPLDQLYDVSHWITPVAATRRFSTRFFAARMPAGQQVTHDGNEVTAQRWITPAAALAEYGRGDLPLMFPTIHHLRAISRHPVCDSWFAELGQQQQITTILPRRLQTPKGARVVLPGEPDYDENQADAEHYG
ncbi:MAG: NUDIX domain-containing protein [Gammaproteobacteria bacterium]|nr:NUDIX domain-containing protein [Gammaproteobacteria bacterium]